MKDHPTTTWFDGSKRPCGLDEASFVIGGTHLLKEFFWRTGEATAGRLLVVAPFLEPGVGREIRFFQTDAVRSFELLLITTPASARSAAAHELAFLGWRSCEIRALKGLHAKLYVTLPPGGSTLALIGSHNLTTPGSCTNTEAGLLISGVSPEAMIAVDAVAENIFELRRKSSPVFDSLIWPHTFAATA